MLQYFSFNPTQPNPSHVLENATQPNPWMDPTHVHLCSTRRPGARASRAELARFLRIESSAGRFGGLRPVYISGEVRWVCETHYVELRAMPSVQLQL